MNIRPDIVVLVVGISLIVGGCQVQTNQSEPQLEPGRHYTCLSENPTTREVENEIGTIDHYLPIEHVPGYKIPAGRLRELRLKLNEIQQLAKNSKNIPWYDLRELNGRINTVRTQLSAF